MVAAWFDYGSLTMVWDKSMASLLSNEGLEPLLVDSEGDPDRVFLRAKWSLMMLQGRY